MICPGCSCSANFEVTIKDGDIAKSYLECEYCGNLWSPGDGVKTIIYMNCPKCSNAIGANVVLNADDKPPKMLCRACGTLWTVRDDANLPSE